MSQFRWLARGLSVVLHPLLVPAYLIAVLLFGLSPAVVPLASAARPWVLSVVALLTFGLPALGTWLLLRAGRISSVELYERRQRPLPLALAGLGFLAATLLVRWHPALYAPVLVQALGGITAALLLTLLVTLWWKISAHGVGMGGAVGMLLWLQLRPALGNSATIYWLFATATLAIAVAWARLYLRAHTPAQVVAGLLAGCAVALASGGLL
ncbi:hypothetical protein F0P96_14030 [Hymenobacter busanensis]|uniref:Uncharacterized protein n=1 Tax=Hymenobacter busanensis TaxID=2607656 RepID=A0A7L4ZYG7_9BACT|nr:phosphatase PAP2 family protein [Hymenobacter busanensis]KAA9331361.1 hypothetical protein F0P96_14030 [Hymenobacter busanensis]QHJ08514.1 hypothetical protein GUY19_14955 [Hymenobacter busanensis]